MKKIFLFAAFGCIANIAAFAQVQTDGKTKQPTHGKQAPKPKTPSSDDAPTFNRLVYGGNVGFQFLTGGFFLNLSPTVGYRVTERFTAGGGIVGQYTSQTTTFPISTTQNKTVSLGYGAYGARAFSQYSLFRGVFVQGELEQIYNSVPYLDDNFDVKYNTRGFPGALVGGGVNLGEGPVRFNITALYNLLYDRNNTFYQSPYVIRGGVGFGF